MKSKVRFKGKLRSYLCWPLWLTIPMTLADVGLYFYDVTAGFLLTVFIAVYFVLELGLYYNTRPRLANEIINFATQYATVQKKLLNEFEIPYALLDYTGKILWVNERFSELTGVGRNYHKSITTLFSNITREFLQKHEDAQNITIEKKERIFRISLNRIYFDDIMEESKEIDVKDSDEFLTALYLFDETELQHCKQENLDQKQVSALVYIDNYDEALDSIEDVKRSLLIALVDRKVNQYFSKMDALVRKIEKDKYFVVFKYKYLQKLMDDAEMEAMMYKIEGEDLYLIGTSEHSMIGKFKGQIVEEKSLPITMTSYSPCFRKEVGSHGIEERGVYRVHQFEKQEMVVLCKPEDSMDWYNKMWSYTVEFFRSLDVPVRTLECCSGDLADLKVKSCDVEAWSPRQKKYFEVGSCSTLGDAQARRLGIRTKGENGTYLVHTLNNTVLASPRGLIAFLENNVNEDGSVNIPVALRPYMGGKEKVLPKK